MIGWRVLVKRKAWEWRSGSGASTEFNVIKSISSSHLVRAQVWRRHKVVCGVVAEPTYNFLAMLSGPRLLLLVSIVLFDSLKLVKVAVSIILIFV